MPEASARDFPFVASRSSSARVRKADREGRDARRWEVVPWVPANAARCIRRAACRRRVDVRWEAAQWVGVLWGLVRDCRRRERLRAVRERVRERRTGVRDNATSRLVASKKDR